MNQKLFEAKKNHHHVWAKYMKRWSSNGKDVYITTRQKKIISHSVRDIAVEPFFYKVGYLNKEHIEVIKGFSKFADKKLQEHHMSYLSDFIFLQQLEEKYKASSIKDATIEKYIEALKCNGIENYHTAHENEVQYILESLANRDLTILNEDNNMLNFMQFYAHQITRTKNFKDNVTLTISRANNYSEVNIKKLIDECWWFLSYMFGMNIGRSLFFERHVDNHCLLINDTSKPFITSDQPVINAYQKTNDEVKPPEEHECDHYFPISPNIAYMINKSDRFARGKVEVTEDIVDEMNAKIAKSANTNIISNSEESLKPYRKYVGTWQMKVRESLSGKP